MGRLKNCGELSIIFVSDPEIKRINKQFLKKNNPTDVIAFNYTPILRAARAKENIKKIPFGDIYISVESARKQAKNGGHGLLQELALLILHGLLHLAGYEDETVSKRKNMFRAQKKLFRKINPKLAPPDFR